MTGNYPDGFAQADHDAEFNQTPWPCDEGNHERCPGYYPPMGDVDEDWECACECHYMPQPGER